MVASWLLETVQLLLRPGLSVLMRPVGRRVRELQVIRVVQQVLVVQQMAGVEVHRITARRRLDAKQRSELVTLLPTAQQLLELEHLEPAPMENVAL